MTAAVRAAAVGAALVFLGLPPATAGAQQRGHGHHRFHHRPVGSRLIVVAPFVPFGFYRSEEHTSELQSLTNLVCRLLLEKKKKAGAKKARSTRVEHMNNHKRNKPE